MLKFMLQSNVFAAVVNFDQLPDVLLTVVFLGITGLLIFGVSYFVMHLVLPFSIRKEIETDQNPALSILIAALVIGIAIIIAGAI